MNRSIEPGKLPSFDFHAYARAQDVLKPLIAVNQSSFPHRRECFPIRARSTHSTSKTS